VLRDPYPYPDSVGGLGDGTVDLTFLATSTTYDVDQEGSYAIFSSSESGGRSITLQLYRSLQPEGIESLKIDFAVGPGGLDGKLIQANFTSTVQGGFSYIDGLVGKDGSITVEETADGRYVGSLSATLQGGDPPHEEPLTATFDVAVEKYAFPPELSCNFPEGPPP
jgi:hypothetical protein